VFVSHLLGRFRHNQGGAAALEFALVAPALVLLIVGIIAIGWAAAR
jgi:Flp pilus assembly protein TadG